MTITIPVQIRGKTLGQVELENIRSLLQEHPQKSRSFISYRVCEELNWMQPNGKPQDVACREILRRLEQAELIHLPPARNLTPNQRKALSGALEPHPELDLIATPAKGSLNDFSTVRLVLAKDEETAKLWRDMIRRYHYLGYQWSVGRSVKYLFYIGHDLIGAMSWGSACWKLACRDAFVGWNQATRIRNLQMLAGNHRFLILPWVQIKNLASHVLSLAARQLSQDWRNIYGIELALLESFVDPSRFKGTCYKAANWIYLGQSKGSSKSGNHYHFHGHVKDIYVYPLTPEFRKRLMAT